MKRKCDRCNVDKREENLVFIKGLYLCKSCEGVQEEFMQLGYILQFHRITNTELDRIIEFLPSMMEDYAEYCDDYSTSDIADDDPRTVDELRGICLKLACYWLSRLVK